MEIDTRSEFGTRAARRLRDEKLGWLVTVRANGTPQPVPVWFLWDGEALLIYSRPGTAKLRNLVGSPQVAFHLDGDGRGGDIVVLTGEARTLSDASPADRVPAYLEKYREAIARIGMTPDSFARAYSVAIRVVPIRLEGH